MINNELKSCCDDCNYAKIISVSDYDASTIGYGSICRTRIYCDHMEVCKRYIDHKDIEVDNVKKGKWIPSDIPCEKYVCSECGGACWYYDVGEVVSKSSYCPNCGAKMEV